MVFAARCRSRREILFAQIQLPFPRAELFCAAAAAEQTERQSRWPARGTSPFQSAREEAGAGVAKLRRTTMWRHRGMQRERMKKFLLRRKRRLPTNMFLPAQ